MTLVGLLQGPITATLETLLVILSEVLTLYNIYELNLGLPLSDS